MPRNLVTEKKEREGGGGGNTRSRTISVSVFRVQTCGLPFCSFSFKRGKREREQKGRTEGVGVIFPSVGGPWWATTWEGGEKKTGRKGGQRKSFLSRLAKACQGTGPQRKKREKGESIERSTGAVRKALPLRTGPTFVGDTEKKEKGGEGIGKGRRWPVGGGQDLSWACPRSGRTERKKKKGKKKKKSVKGKSVHYLEALFLDDRVGEHFPGEEGEKKKGKKKEEQRERGKP